MTINIKLSLCKITRASRLFQRNFYLPLLKPLSPQDALRRKKITGQNVLGDRYEHYIPVLTSHDDKLRDKKSRPKGAPIIKKRVKRKDNEKYVAPFFDDNMENHLLLQSVLGKKGKDKEQFYIYDIPDKKCVLVLPFLVEKAIKDKDIIDVVIAQRSEKIVLRLNNGKRVTMPIAKFDSDGAMYRGSGWTKHDIEDEHHHGKETMYLAKIFEAKEAGIEDWELEMMKMANKRKKKVKGEDNPDWNVVMQAAAENIDWEQFEEDTKIIVEEADQYVESEDIPMAVDDMEKTKNVYEKLMDGGEEALSRLPTMKQIPEVIKMLETGETCELENVSGVKVQMSDGSECFVAGQMVKTEENEIFMPGQTLQTETGTSEYIPGITVLMDDEPSLIPGLVFGEEEKPAVFLPGEATITESGQLEFEATEDDLPPKETTPPPMSSLPSRRLSTAKVIDTVIKREKSPPVLSFRPERQPLEDCLVLYEERRKRAEELERKRMKERTEEKILKKENQVDTIRYQVRMKLRNFKVEQPGPYRPVEPVEKSKQLVELERSINEGNFETDNAKMIMQKVRNNARKYRHMMLMSGYGFDGFSGGASGNVERPPIS